MPFIDLFGPHLVQLAGSISASRKDRIETHRLREKRRSSETKGRRKWDASTTDVLAQMARARRNAQIEFRSPRTYPWKGRRRVRPISSNEHTNGKIVLIP